MASSRPEPTWQCVMICWGDRYGAEVINHLASKIAQSAGSHPRFVLMTDRSRNGLLPEIKTVGFPAFYLQDAFKGGGCQAKLGMFEKGVLPEDLPAVYVDLDTAILGDLTKAFDFQPVEETIQMLQSAILPFGGLARLIYRINSKRKYARGNSSIVVFHPARCHFIAEEFQALYEKHGGLGIRPMVADERFISWVAQPRMRALPKSFAVKFPTEYMLPSKALCYLRSSLPWVRRRREKLVAITFCGLSNKPETLIELQEDEEVVDNKNRILIWNDRILGNLRRRLVEYYAG